MLSKDKSTINYENRYHFLIDNVLQIVGELDSKGIFTYVNPYIYDELGYQPKDVIGRTIFEFIHPDDDKKIIRLFHRRVKYHGYISEIRLKNNKNQFIWFEIKTSRIKDFDRKLGSIITLRNISKFKSLENIFQEQQENYQNITNSIPEIQFWKVLTPKKYKGIIHATSKMLKVIIENIPQCVYWKDTNFKYLGCNRNFTEFIGVDRPESIIGKTNEDLFSDEEKILQIREYEDKVIQSGKPIYHTNEIWVTEEREKIWLDINRVPLFDSDKNVIGILIAFEEITDRKTLEQELKSSEERYRNLFNNSPNMIALVDLKGNVVDVNESIIKFTGEEKYNLVGSNFQDFDNFFTGNLPFIIKKYKEILTKGSLESFELLLQDKNKRKTWVNLQASLIDIKNEVFILIIMEDITERKNTEQALKESEERYRVFVENFQGIAFQGNIDFTPIFFHGNVEKITGYIEKDFVSGNPRWDQIILNEDKEKIYERIKKIHNVPNIAIEREYRIIAKDGKIKWIHEIIQNVSDENGKPYMVQGIIHEITDRKNAEQALKESEEKYRILVEKSLQGICILQDIKIVFSNEALAGILGYTVKDLYSMSSEQVSNLIFIEDREWVLKRHKDRLTGKDVPSHYEFRVIRKGNQIRWVEMYASMVEYGGKPAIQEVFIDITERKKAERSLLESEEKFRTMAEQSLIGIQILQDNRTKYINQQWGKISGFSVEEIMKWNLEDHLKFIHPDDRKLVRQQLEKKQRGEQDVINQYQVRCTKKSGETIWVEIFAKSINYESKFADFVMIIDISDRKRAEQKLEESEEKYRLISENANDLIVVLNRDFSYEYINEQVHKKLLGYSWKDLSDKSPLTFAHPNDVEEASKALRKGFKIGEGMGEVRIRHKNGIYRWFEVKGKIFKDKDGIKKALLISRDNTERKKAELKLKESEEKFRTIAEQSLVGIIILQENKIRYVNSAAANMLNFTVDEILNTPTGDFINFIHPDDRRFVIEQAKKRQKGIETEISGYQCRCIEKNGEIIWTQNYSKTINYEGEFADLVIVIDITCQKKAEQKLKESEEKFRTIAEQALMGIAILQDNKVAYVNNYVTTLLGYSSEEIKSWQPGEYSNTIYPEDKELALEQAKKKQTGLKDVITHYQCRVIKKTRELIWIDNYSKTINYKGRLADIATFIDITEKIEAVQKLKESERKYRQLIEDSLEGVWVINSEAIITLVNPSMAEILGYTINEMIGKSVFSFMDESEAKIAREQIENQKKGISAERDSVIIHKNGKKVLIKLRASPIFDDEGNYKGTMAFITDITKRKKVELELKESKKLLQRTFDSLNDAIFILNAENPPKIIDCNSAAEKIFGYSNIEMIGQDTGFLHVNEEELQKFQNHLYPIIKEHGSLQDFEFKMKAKSEVIFFTEHSIQPLVDDLGTRYGWVTVVRDISNRKETERQLIESEQKYRNLVETSSMGLLEIDVRKGGVVFINPRLLEIIGYTQDELISNGMFYKAIYTEDYKKVTKSEEDRDVEFRIINKEGQIKWLSGRTLHIHNDQGKLSYLRLWLQDITEKKELEEIKSNLITRISHEFKTPLISIKGFTELLLTDYKRNLNKRMISFLERIKEGSDRLKLLINRFIETIQLNKQLVKLNKSYINFHKLIKTGIAEMESLIKLRNHTISFDIPDEIIMYLDKEKIRTVISNLLTNAIKYTPSGGNIIINSRIKKKSLIISIKDDGIGLQKEEITQLFKPFGKIEKYGRGWDIISEGIGLGLYLSKEIIDLHEGKIWVESAGLNKGSTFYFSLPIIGNNNSSKTM